MTSEAPAETALVLAPDAPIIGFQIRPYHWRMRRARKAARLSQADLALLTGIHLKRLGPIETLHCKPTPDEKQEIADALAVDAATLWPELLDTLPVVRRGEEFSLDQAQVVALQSQERFDAVDHQLANGALRAALDRAMATLPPREQEVVRARFGLDGQGPRTLAAVGEQLGVTPVRAQQIEQQAFRKLRAPHRAHALRAFLEQPR